MYFYIVNFILRINSFTYIQKSNSIFTNLIIQKIKNNFNRNHVSVKKEFIRQLSGQNKPLNKREHPLL